MNKPTVRYKNHPKNYIKVGDGAVIQPIDHPSHLVSNSTWVRTSDVLKVTDKGFETHNTIYVGEGHE